MKPLSRQRSKGNKKAAGFAPAAFEVEVCLFDFFKIGVNNVVVFFRFGFRRALFSSLCTAGTGGRTLRFIHCFAQFQGSLHESV